MRGFTTADLCVLAFCAGFPFRVQPTCSAAVKVVSIEMLERCGAVIVCSHFIPLSLSVHQHSNSTFHAFCRKLEAQCACSEMLLPVSNSLAEITPGQLQWQAGVTFGLMPLMRQALVYCPQDIHCIYADTWTFRRTVWTIKV